MHKEQLDELLYQSLETERGGVKTTRRPSGVRRTTI